MNIFTVGLLYKRLKVQHVVNIILFTSFYFTFRLFCSWLYGGERYV